VSDLRTLLPALLAHVALGCALAALLWVAGTAWLAALPGMRPAERRRADLVLGYPLGLLAAIAVAFAALFGPRWAVLALAVALGPLALARSRAAVRELAGIGRDVLAALPFAGLFGVLLGYYDHGPTATMDSHAFGDLIFWIARATSMRRDPLHVHDLVTAGSQIPQHEAGAAALNAAAVGTLHADPFLVYATAIPVCGLLSLVAGFAMLGRPAVRWAGAAVALVAAGSMVYPSVLASGPPVGLALPLALVLVALLRVRIGLAALAGHVLLVGLALAATKPFGAVCLIAWLPLALAPYARRAGPLRLALAVAAPLVVGAVIVALTRNATANAFDALEPRCFPCHAVGDAWSLRHARSTPKAAGILELAGQLLLLVALWRGRRRWTLLPVGAGFLVFWFVGGKGFDIAAAIAALIALGVLVLDEEPRQVGLVALAGAALALKGAFADTAQIGAALAFVVALVATFLARPRLVLRVAAGTAAATALVLVGAHGFGRYDMTVLPHEQYEVWRAVHQLTPKDALVFTSQTGSDTSEETGWNYYPGVGARQVAIAGWIYSGLAGNPHALQKRLAQNSAVLLGKTGPAQLPLARGHSAYYAVLWTDQPAPRSFRPLYANHLFVLYRVPAAHPSRVFLSRYSCQTYDDCVARPAPVVVPPPTSIAR
jgi:hypothetical protein